VYPVDVETRRQLAVDHAAMLMASAREAGPGRRRVRQWFGLWLVHVGLRLACEQRQLSQA
jgi:hypothetical protein